MRMMPLCIFWIVLNRSHALVPRVDLGLMSFGLYVDSNLFGLLLEYEMMVTMILLISRVER